jgi:hypothetical protein
MDQELYVRHMRWVAVVVGALVLAAPAAAGTSVKVPAPALGKERIELITIKASKAPSFTVTNLSALGPGFGAVAIAKKGKSGTYAVYLVMFMGTRSTSPAGTVDLKVGGGTFVGAPADETDNCRALKDALTGLNDGAITGLDKSGSTPKHEATNDLKYQLGALSCK